MSSDDIVPGFSEEKNDTIKIRLQKIDEVTDCLVFYLTGYIDTYNSNFFRKKIARVIEAGFTRLIFNCTSLSYVSSTGIGTFTEILKAVKPRGGDMVFSEVQPKVMDVFKLLGFSRFFTIKDNLTESVTFFTDKKKMERAGPFPKIFACPICSKKLKAAKAGRFRCPSCKSILAVNDSGKVLLS